MGRRLTRNSRVVHCVFCAVYARDFQLTSWRLHILRNGGRCQMAQLTSLLAAGLGVALVCDVFLAPSALTSASALGGGNMVASADTSILKVTSQEPLVHVDRSRKGDRLAGAHTSQV